MYRFSLKDPHFLPHFGCDVEFTIHPHELVTLVGPNGIGKTSVMCRLFKDHPSVTQVEQGSLDYFYDRTLGKIKSIFTMTRPEDIDLDYFHALWKTFHLDKKENRLQSALSGGESQALKLCLGLSVKKEMYFLDEPTQYLDSEMKNSLNKIVTKLLEKKKSILMIEHDLTWITNKHRVYQLELEDNTLKARERWTT